MSVLLGAMPGRATGHAVDQDAGRIERDRRRGRRRRLAMAPSLAGGDRVDGAEHVAVAVVLDDGRGGAGLVDRDGDDGAGEEALVELPRRAVDVERAVLADPAAGARGERGRELVLIDRTGDGLGPLLRGRPAEQPAVGCAVIMLVEERQEAD